MKHPNRWMFALLIIVALPFATTTSVTGAGKSIGKPSGVVPSVVEEIPGSEIKRVTLTERAIQRIALQTSSVNEEQLGGSFRKVVPYASLIYDPHGGTWVYTSPQPLTFVRASVDVDFIKGDWVVLHEGPPVGTTVATFGVAELYGAEFEVGH